MQSTRLKPPSMHGAIGVENRDQLSSSQSAERQGESPGPFLGALDPKHPQTPDFNGTRNGIRRGNPCRNTVLELIRTLPYRPL